MAKEKEVRVQEEVEAVNDEIVVGSPLDLRPKALPLVVKLPASANMAQVAYAKTLNGYAYQNPEKWELKKDALIKKLKAFENVSDEEFLMSQESNLKVNKTSF